ncbi:MAG: hypothetical protein GX924_07160 [Clostridiaceae bacterium]|nr:hypothetical protein [Clostridiaceae bacterium]
MKFNGIDSSAFPSLTVTKKGTRQTPKKIYEDYGVLPGTSRALFEDTGQYLPYKRSMAFLVKDPADFRSVTVWLDGTGNLEIEEGGYYKSRVAKTDQEDLLCGWRLYEVEFEVQPFFWLGSGLETVTLTSAGAISNPGNLPSKPIIKIYGSGNITLNVGAKSYQLTDVNEYIAIDSDLKQVYKEQLNQGKKLVGGFPTLNVGSNNISWTGNVTKLEIKGNWIDL